VRIAPRKMRSASQCTAWIVDPIRVGRSCNRFEGRTLPTRRSIGLICAREAPSAACARCPKRADARAGLC
jgi:hypothetical protein